jgi:cytochrome c-type biogenesis protein CcmE
VNSRFVFGGMAIVAAVGWLMFTAIRETSSYYLTIEEFLPRREALAGTAVRVAGRVKSGSVEYDPRTLHLRFEMGEFEEEGAYAGAAAPSQGALYVPVAFTGIKPDMFAEGRDVIVEGHYAEGTLQADKVLTSCPSKYEAELEPEEQVAGSG